MKLSPRAIDKCAFTFIYLVVAVLVVWGGGKVANYAADFGFYRDFVMPWEVRLMEMRHSSIRLPTFDQHHPVAYMQSVADRMKRSGLQLPQSNTREAFIYRLSRFGNETRNILLVYQDNKIVMYGLPSATFKRLDRFVDGRPDSNKGNFTGRLSSDQTSIIGSWHF